MRRPYALRPVAFHPGAGRHLRANTRLASEFNAASVHIISARDAVENDKWSRRGGKDRASTILDHAAHKTGSHLQRTGELVL
jgi:hypothetical protein